MTSVESFEPRENDTIREARTRMHESFNKAQAGDTSDENLRAYAVARADLVSATFVVNKLATEVEVKISRDELIESTFNSLKAHFSQN